MARFTVPSISPTASEASSHTLGRTPSPSPPAPSSPVRSEPRKPRFNTPKPYVSPFKAWTRSRGSPPRSKARSSPAKTPSSPSSPKAPSPVGSPKNARSAAVSKSPVRTALARSSVKTPGRLGKASTKGKSLLILNETPGKRPKITLNSPSSPGLSWQDGAVWWLERSEELGYPVIGREVFDSGDAAISSETASQVQSRLRHPNLINLVDFDGFGDEKKRNETLWEFADGGTLNHLILTRKMPEGLPTKRGSQGLPEMLVLRALLNVLNAVNYLHSGNNCLKHVNNRPGWQPVVHNLINPANVFNRHTLGKPTPDLPYGRFMLGNFSRSVVLPSIHDPVDQSEETDRREAFAHLRGLGEETGYEAPELLAEGSYVPGPCSDLWSIGALAVAMMTGRTVWDLLLEIDFRRDVDGKIPRGQVVERWQDVPLGERHALLLSMAGDATIAFALPKQYDDRLKTLVEGLLMFEPADRVGNAAEVYADVMMLFEDRRAAVGDGSMIAFEEWQEGDDSEEALRKYEEVARETRRMLDSR